MKGMDHGDSGGGETSRRDTTGGGMAWMDHSNMAHDSMGAGSGGMARELVMEDGRYSDRAIIDAMVPHHQGAVEMAQVAADRSRDPFVRRLAAQIMRSQTAEIATLRREDAELAEAGVERGDLGVPHHMQGMDMDPQALRTADPVERAFFEQMLPHHEGAIVMARAELERGDDPELRALARTIIADQQREIAAMRERLAS